MKRRKFLVSILAGLLGGPCVAVKSTSDTLSTIEAAMKKYHRRTGLTGPILRARLVLNTRDVSLLPKRTLRMAWKSEQEFGLNRGTLGAT